jgi:hypothetical protein
MICNHLLDPWKKYPGIHQIGNWVGPRASLDGFGEEKNLSSLLGFDTQTVHPVARWDINHVILATNICVCTVSSTFM